MKLPLLTNGSESENCCVCGTMTKTQIPQSSFVNSQKHLEANEQLHRNSEDAFDAFLEVPPDAIVVANRDGQIVRVNAHTENLFLYSRQELLGKQIETLMPERCRERHLHYRNAYANSPKAQPMGLGQDSLFGLRSDGQEFPIEIRIGIITINNELLVISAIRDIFERRRPETELAERTKQLEIANRNKDEFIGILAHELRSPLAAVCMAVDVLHPHPSTDETEQFWEIIKRQTEQMLHLIEDLMDVSRIAQAKVRIQKVQVDLVPLIHQAIEAVQPLLKIHKHQLSVFLPTSPVMIIADPVRLVEVFTNLLTNASKYTHEGGQIHLQATKDGDRVVIEFRDNGIGIDTEMLTRIFEPFAQVAGAMNHSEGGIGLGLAMVSHLVRLHAGTVHAFSNGPGYGSQFVVNLPLPHSQNASSQICEAPDLLSKEPCSSPERPRERPI